MATIKDVAELAGVSIATVSNYLNHTKPVSSSAAEKIQDAVEELNYSQNLSAKMLKSKTYTDVGVILPNINDPYYVQIFQGIDNAFQNSEYFVNLAFSYDIPELEDSIARSMLKKQVCGLILASCQPDKWKFYYDNFTAKKKPVVMIDRMIKSLDANYVTFDNYSVMLGITKRMIEKGYENLYLLTGSFEFECEDNCRRGFLEGYEEMGMTQPVWQVIVSELNKEDAFRKTVHLLKSDVPDALISTSENTAAGIIEALRLTGNDRIPVITLGEDHWNNYTHSFATLSTLRPAIKIGGTASELLLAQLKQPIRETEKIIFDAGQTDLDAFLESMPKRKKSVPPKPPKKHIELLMLDTPVVHAFGGLIKNFEDRSGIGVKVSIMSHRHLFSEIEAGFGDGSGQKYDAFMYDIPWLSSLASRGMLADITDDMKNFDTDAFFPGCLSHFSEFHGRMYGVPFMYAPQMFYYRKDLFDDPELKASFMKHYGSKLRPPITLKEFNAMAEFFTTKTDVIEYGISVAAAYDECLAPELYMRLRAYGSEVFGSDGAVKFDDPQTLKAFINLKRALKVAKPDYLQSNDVSIVQDFLRGETAMLITYPAFLTDVSDLRKNSLVGSIGYSLIPGRAPILGGWSIGINSRSANRAETAEFLKWTCGRQISNYFTLLGGQTAVTDSYTNDELVKLYPWLPMYYSAYEHTSPTVMPEMADGRIIPSDKVDNIICKWTYDFIFDRVDAQTAISSIQRELETFVADYANG